MCAEKAPTREYARLEDVMPLAWRKLEKEEIKEVAEFFQKHRSFPPRAEDQMSRVLGGLDVTTYLKDVERNDPTLAHVLSRLDQKLNLLLRLFHYDANAMLMNPTPVNLSGGGIGFWEFEPDVAAEDFIELKIGLSENALATVSCYAQVVRLFPNDRQDLTRVACKFNPILDNDRERIVQYIFQRQNEILRAKRAQG